ncbi:Crp/Fnr family transcriptional regulator [Microvirga pudoricolor]|uniref:Crp/Fnr family transcriptional regulator n=1 Tax=Microvirga pudoricolor TaxID=2778729 RepID=UPI00194F7F96|nr:Crp/Fnr family transcriptional regulator [Microvirga pudoricolor]MBM6593192.1 Crp/Fnr family transcriptional regulator [Microvirga pudoricolor]
MLKQLALFRDIPPDLMERLASHVRMSHCTPGQRIFEKGDTALGLFGVLSGLVQIRALSPAGSGIVLNLIGPGEVFGEIALLDGNTRTADAVAFTECHLLTVDGRDFNATLSGNPSMALKVLSLVSSRLRRTSEQVEEIAFADLPTRLAKALLWLSDQQRESPGGIRPNRITITQKELGRTVGFSRESTNKCLREWEDAGHLRLEKGGCTILNYGFLHKVTAFSDLTA